MHTRFIDPAMLTFDPVRVRAFLRLRSGWDGAPGMLESARVEHQRLLAAVRPAYQYDCLPVGAVDEHRMTVRLSESAVFQGDGIVRLLHGCAFALPFILTLGADEEHPPSDDPVRQFVCHGVRSSMTVSILACLRTELEEAARGQGCSITYRYAPGYPRWRLEDQNPLFSLLRPSEVGMSLSPQFVMIPRYSLSGVYGWRRKRTEKAGV